MRRMKTDVGLACQVGYVHIKGDIVNVQEATNTPQGGFFLDSLNGERSVLIPSNELDVFTEAIEDQQ